MNNNWQTKVIVIGAIVGAVAGIIGASILIQQAQKNNTQPQLTPGDGVKVGLGVLGVLRLLADSGTR